jgi:hypothetical protein
MRSSSCNRWHDDDDGAVLLVILPAVEGMVEPLVCGLPLRIGQRLLRLQRIVDQDDVGAASGQHAAIAGGEPVPLAGGQELLHRLPVRSEAGWKNPPIPRAHHDAAAVSSELIRESFSVAHAKDLGRGIMPETERREGDRGQQRFQVTRRQVNNQPPDPAFAHRGQFGGDDLKVPVHRELGLRVQIVEAARREGRKILPQEDLVLGPGQVLDHHFSTFEKRALSCSMTFSSAESKEVSAEAGSVRASIA